MRENERNGEKSARKMNIKFKSGNRQTDALIKKKQTPKKKNYEIWFDCSNKMVRYTHDLDAQRKD